MSVVDPALANPIRPAFAIPGEAVKAGGTPEPGAVVPQEPARSRAVIAALKMIKHPEVCTVVCFLPRISLSLSPFRRVGCLAFVRL